MDNVAREAGMAKEPGFAVECHTCNAEIGRYATADEASAACLRHETETVTRKRGKSGRPMKYATESHTVFYGWQED